MLQTRSIPALIALAPLALALPQEIERTRPAANWPQFRGPGARGVADPASTPASWDVEKGTNVRWRVAVPGLAHSSPIVWGERIYLTTAVTEGGEADLKVGLYGDIVPVDDAGPQHFQVLSLDRSAGETVWTRTVFEGSPAIRRHPKGSHAASTPATDGKHVVAFFGSEGLFCFDAQGKELWRKDFGVLDSGYYLVPAAQWGFASSPVIHDGRVYVLADVQKGSFLAAFDVATGEQIWRTERDDVPTWGSPTVDVENDRSQVIVNGWKHIGGYDLKTGDELWKAAGGGDIPVPTPIVWRDLIFITNAHGRDRPVLAIHADATGEFDMDPEVSAQLAWSNLRAGNYMQTPLVVDGLLYCCADNGVLACYDARSGAQKYRERLGSGRTGFTASAIAAGGRLYFTSEEGGVHVVKAGPAFELLAVNELGEECMASPAASAGVLYWRTRGHLVAIGSE